MRLFTFLLLAYATLFGACTEEGKKAPENRPAEKERPFPTSDFYKRLTGTIAGQPVVMHLHRMGDWVGGVYAYNAVGIPISLVSWNDAAPGDEVIELQEFSEAGPLNDSYTYPRLHLTLTGDGAKGTWISADSGKRFDVLLKETYNDGSIRLDVISFFDSARLLRSRPMPQATASYATVLSQEADAWWMDGIIKSHFGMDEEFVRSDRQDFFRAPAAEYFAEYRSTASEVDTTDPTVLESAMLNYSTETRLTVLMNDAGWLVLRSLSASYTGGAHGNHGSSFLVLDAQSSGRRWMLTDVVADTAALGPFLQTAALDRWRLSPETPLTERLLVDAVPVTDNFYLTPTGLGFVYNPYEIASYADGEVHLFVPYKRIGMLLTEEFKQRLKLSNSAVMRG